MTDADGLDLTQPNLDDNDDDDDDSKNARPVLPPIVSVKRGSGINGVRSRAVHYFLRHSHERWFLQDCAQTLRCSHLYPVEGFHAGSECLRDFVGSVLPVGFDEQVEPISDSSSDGWWRQWEPARSTDRSLWKEDTVCPWDSGDYASSKANVDDTTVGSRLWKLFKWFRGDQEHGG